MNTFLEYLAVVIFFSLLGGPALVGAIHDRRIDRQLREAEHRSAPDTPTGYASRDVTRDDIARAA